MCFFFPEMGFFSRLLSQSILWAFEINLKTQKGEGVGFFLEIKLTGLIFEVLRYCSIPSHLSPFPWKPLLQIHRPLKHLALRSHRWPPQLPSAVNKKDVNKLQFQKNFRHSLFLFSSNNFDDSWLSAKFSGLKLANSTHVLSISTLHKHYYN